MKNIAIIQARTGSTRLPNKVLKKIENKPVLQHVIERVSESKLLDELVVATTISYDDLKIVELCAKLGIRVYCGSEEDVLDRYYQAAKLVQADNVIRITADCPLHDSNIIDRVVQTHINEDSDYTSNILKETFPDGLDCEIIKYTILEEAWKNAKLASEREHVTPYIKQQKNYKKSLVINNKNYGNYRWTLDTEQDFIFISSVYKELYKNNPHFKYENIINLLEEKPELCQINQCIERNEGLKISLENEYKFLD